MPAAIPAVICAIPDVKTMNRISASEIEHLVMFWEKCKVYAVPKGNLKAGRGKAPHEIWLTFIYGNLSVCPENGMLKF